MGTCAAVDGQAAGHQKPSKREQPFALARDKISMYGDRVHIYTDASKGQGGRVGIGCYVDMTA
jgi:hypothetical protein